MKRWHGTARQACPVVPMEAAAEAGLPLWVGGEAYIGHGGHHRAEGGPGSACASPGQSWQAWPFSLRSRITGLPTFFVTNMFLANFLLQQLPGPSPWKAHCDKTVHGAHLGELWKNKKKRGKPCIVQPLLTFWSFSFYLFLYDFYFSLF